MAIEQNCFELDDDHSAKQKFSPILNSTRTSETNIGSFNCNICLDSACDPVVTLCGHLYCWPCIYKWLHDQNFSTEPKNKTQRGNCPVCKANLSDSSFVPLYGLGKSKSDKSNSGAVVPSRPQPSVRPNRQHHSTTRPPPYFLPHQQSFAHPYGGYATLHSSNLMGTTMASLVNPTIGIFREILRTSDQNVFTYSYPTVQPILASGSSPRLRRQEMQLDKSLSRVLIFLICFVVLCLLTF